MLIRTKKRKDNITKLFHGANVNIFVKYEDFKDKIPSNLNQVGSGFVPFPTNGPWSNKNANGYVIIDRKSKKERRVINSFYMYPYGNTNADPILVDITRLCYKRIYVEGLNIEMVLDKDENGEVYIRANLPTPYTELEFVTAVNIFIEMFGCCIADKELRVAPLKEKIRHNWVFIPKGKKPSEIVKGNVSVVGNVVKGKFYKERLEIIESYPFEEAHEGLMGYQGYFAYIFKNICIFDTDVYGNATYIVKKENWEEISKKTKKELVDEGLVLDKIIHSKDWENNFKDAFSKFENI